jgi:hypothetical protein
MTYFPLSTKPFVDQSISRLLFEELNEIDGLLMTFLKHREYEHRVYDD